MMEQGKRGGNGETKRGNEGGLGDGRLHLHSPFPKSHHGPLTLSTTALGNFQFHCSRHGRDGTLLLFLPIAFCFLPSQHYSNLLPVPSMYLASQAFTRSLLAESFPFCCTSDVNLRTFSRPCDFSLYSLHLLLAHLPHFLLACTNLIL